MKEGKGKKRSEQWTEIEEKCKKAEWIAWRGGKMEGRAVECCALIDTSTSQQKLCLLDFFGLLFELRLNPNNELIFKEQRC